MNAHRKYTDELLIDYVEGLLNSEQSTRVEAILADDEYARSMVDGIRLWFERNGDNREGLEAWLNEEMPPQQSSQVESETRIVPMRKYLPWVAAAVIVLALVPMWFALQSPDYNELMAEYLAEVYEYPHAVRDSGEESKRAFLEYDEGHFTEAAELFEQLSKDNPDDQLTTFMLGMSLFNGQQYSASATTLRELTTGESRFAQQASWYYALASLHTGNIQKGTLALELIVKKRAYRFEEAELLLTEIKSENIGSP